MKFDIAIEDINKIQDHLDTLKTLMLLDKDAEYMSWVEKAVNHEVKVIYEVLYNIQAEEDETPKTVSDIDEFIDIVTIPLAREFLRQYREKDFNIPEGTIWKSSTPMDNPGEPDISRPSVGGTCTFTFKL